MSPAKYSTQVCEAFAKEYLPMDNMILSCGTDMLFEDKDDNLIHVNIRMVRPEREQMVIDEYVEKNAILERKREHERVLQHNRTLPL